MRNFYYDEEELNTDSGYDPDYEVSESDIPETDVNDADGDMEGSGEDYDDYSSESYSEEYSSESRERAEQSRQHRAHKVLALRIVLIILGCLAGAAVAIYLVGCSYFTDHFAFHTTLNGTDVSMMTEEEVDEMLASAASDYTLTITGRNQVTDSVTGAEIGLKPAYGNSITSLIVLQDSFAWPKTLFTETELTSTSTAVWDAEMLAAKIDDLAFFDPANETAPVNATYELTSSGYQIVPENDGVLPDKEAVTEKIEDALYSFASDLVLDDSCYEKAAVTSDNAELVAEVEELNKLAGMTVTIPFGDETETLDGTMLGTWIITSGSSVSTDSSEENSAETAASTDSAAASSASFSVSLDESKVSAYVASLAEQYDTYGKDRSFRTTGGSVVTVSGGSYGWLMDRDTTTANLIAFLNAGESGSFDVTWTQEAAQHGDDDIGDSYCEVDLDDQHVWVYVDGELVVSTDCVSGKAIDPDRATPDGTYSIVYRKSPATLRGEGYESPVTYWMPFNRGIGFHDATWRSKFGGEIYLTSGSHGCINLPLDAAEEIYNNVYSGMPVIVYGGMTPEEAQEYTGQHPQTASESSGTQDSSVTEGTTDEETRRQQEEAVIAQAVQNYVNQGMSEADAQAKVQQDLASQLADQIAAQQAAEAAAAQAEANAAGGAAASSQ